MSISVKLSSVTSPWYICKSQSDKFKNNNYSENTGLGNNLFQLSAILSNDKQIETGSFELGIFKITINKIKTYEENLIKCER